MVFHISTTFHKFINFCFVLEAPEPVYDPRTLYERLKEQKDKKQEEYEESKKLKNFVKGLEDDEVEFLQNIDEQKAVLEHRKYEEEMKTLEEFKKTKTNKVTEDQDNLMNEVKREVLLSSSSTKKISSHADKLSKLIKRKVPSSSNSIPSSTNDLRKNIASNDDEESQKSIKKAKTEDSNPLASLLNYDYSDSE